MNYAYYDVFTLMPCGRLCGTTLRRVLTLKPRFERLRSARSRWSRRPGTGYWQGRMWQAGYNRYRA